MSTSPAQLAANTANAQPSTGPRTSEGKNHSSQHASKHGLTAREVIIGKRKLQNEPNTLKRTIRW
jgi:hypothetical protein